MKKSIRIAAITVFVLCFGGTFASAVEVGLDKTSSSDGQRAESTHIVRNLLDGEGDALVMTPLPIRHSPALRSRVVSLAPPVLSGQGLTTGSFWRLILFDDAIVTARIDRVTRTTSGAFTVRGRLLDYSMGTMVLTVHDGRGVVNVDIPELEKKYSILSGDGAVYYLLDLDVKAQTPLEGGPALRPPSSKSQGPLDLDAARGPLDDVIVDVMMAYTPAARSWADTHGGGIGNVIAQALAKGQIAMDNSDAYVTLRLVHSAEVPYTESGDSITDLERLTTPGDGHMEAVHAQRDTYGADIVTLLTLCNDVGGLAWLLESTSGSPAYAFNLCRVQQASYTYTVVHEMGHNMGLGHAKSQNFQAGPGIFGYSAGWRWRGSDSGYYCSVMSYEDGSYFSDGIDHVRVGYFSNPSVSHLGSATGHAVDGDNARTLRETKEIVAAYRSAAATLIPPTGVTASDGLYTNRVAISWTSASGASLYKVYRHTVNESSGASLIGNAVSTFHDDTTAAAGTLYYYWVKASDGVNDSTFSLPDSGYRLTQNLLAPTGLAASDGTYPDRVRLTWNAAAGATQYKIYRNISSSSGGASLLGTSSTLDYDDTTALLGILYYYWVKSSDGTYESGFSDENSGYRNQGLPGTPAWVDASDGVYANRIRITWANTFGATHYRVSRSSTPGGAKIDVTSWITSQSYDDYSVIPGAYYYYLVLAANDTNGSNVGTPSAEDQGFRKISPPSVLNATRGTYSDKIVVNWNSSTGATHYRVYRGSTPNQLVPLPVSSWITNGVFTNTLSLSLQGTNAFYYSIQAAMSSAGTNPSDFSAETIGQLGLPLNTPAAPTASDGAGTGAVQITWSLVTSGTHYRLSRASSPGGAKSYLTGWTNLFAWSDSGATPGASFYYSVQAATDALGSRASTNSLEDEGWRRLSPPRNFAASEDRTNLVYLSWTASSGASRYRIDRGSVPAGGKTELTGWISGTTYNDTNASLAMPLYYTVTAAVDTNGSRPSDPSEEDRGWVSLPPAAGVQASDGTSTAHVSIVWNAVDGATHYCVFRATSTSGAKTNVSAWLAAMTNFNDNTATSGVTYYYWIQAAVDASGTGAGAYGVYDDGWRAFPGPIIAASDGDYADRVQVSWPAVTGASYYRVYYVVDNVWTTLSGWIASTGYAHTAASPGTDYWYAVQAANSSSGNRAGDRSDSNSGWRMLSAPLNVLASDGSYSNRVRITWNVSVNATHYRVYRAGAVTGEFTQLSAWLADTGFDDETAHPGASYYYTVRAALDDAGYRPSAHSASNEGWRALLAPSPVIASDDLYTDRVEVTWGAVEGAYAYQLYRMTSPGQGTRTSLTGWSNVLGYVDTGASPGVQYYYSVKAATNGAGARSSPFSDEDPGRRSLNAVATGASDGTFSDRIQINWSSVVGASRYQVWRADSPAGDLAPLTGWINATTYDDRTVIPGQDYAYAIQASADTNGNLMGAMGARDTGWRSLPAPGWISVTEGESPLRVRLAAVKGAAVYRLYRASSTSTAQWQNIVGWTNTTDIADPDAWPGVRAYYWVQAALDTNGTRAGNISAYAIGWAPLSSPSDLTASEGLYTNRVLLAWSAAPSSTHHKVYRMREGGADWEELSGWLAATNHGDTSAVPGLVYSYRVVAARDSAGSRASPPSSSRSGWRALAPPVEIVAGDGMLAAGVRVEWMGSAGASAYRVYRSDTSNGSYSALGAWVTNLAYLDAEPVPGVSKYYAVEAACDATGLRPSGVSTADIGWRAVSQPAPVVATDGTLTNLVRVSWSGPNGATRYRLYRAAVADGTRTDLTGWTPDQTFDDTNAATGVEYIYEVRAAADSNGWHTGLYGAEDTGWAASFGVPSAGFQEWADAHGLTGDLQTIFVSDRDGDGLPNGLEYALGTNLVPNEPILTVKLRSGTAVAETTKQDGRTSPEVSVAVEASLSLMTNAWSLPVVHFFGDGIPGNREQWQPQSATTGAVFRLKAVLQP